MGIIYRQAKLLLDARSAGVVFDRLLMIGHQNLFLHTSELRQIRKMYPGALRDYKWGEYADRFFTELLGVIEVSTMDYSPYEGADLLHDLNHPIPVELRNRFDVIVEAGSLEHVFNFPIAIANLMQMTKVGGTIFGSTVSNNLCGHGFYQFSPELIFRIFTLENGFALNRVLALKARYPGVELTPISATFEVTDPAIVGTRVGLMTKRPIMLLFEARKVRQSPLFVRTPMQSDYASAWLSNSKAAVPLVPQWIKQLPFFSSFRNWLARFRSAEWFRNWLMGQGQIRQYSLKNKRFFKKI